MTSMDWQARYIAGDTPWDEGAAHPALVDYITARGPFTGHILVPGCGAGHDVRAISTRDNTVLGLDIAPAAIAKAQALPPAAREQYLAGDFFNIDPELRASFDWLVEHTCFCAIDPTMRPAYAVAAADALKPGAHCFAIFYLNPAVERRPPYGVTVAELDRLFSPFFTTVREWTPERAYPDREGRELIRVMRRLERPEGPRRELQ